jgi:hypothetical protein
MDNARDKTTEVIAITTGIIGLIKAIVSIFKKDKHEDCDCKKHRNKEE